MGSAHQRSADRVGPDGRTLYLAFPLHGRMLVQVGVQCALFLGLWFVFLSDDSLYAKHKFRDYLHQHGESSIQVSLAKDNFSWEAVCSKLVILVKFT